MTNYEPKKKENQTSFNCFRKKQVIGNQQRTLMTYKSKTGNHFQETLKTNKKCKSSGISMDWKNKLISLLRSILQICCNIKQNQFILLGHIKINKIYYYVGEITLPNKNTKVGLSIGQTVEAF